MPGVRPPEHAIASVVCFPSGNPVDSAFYALFPDRATMDSYFDIVSFGPTQPCPGNPQQTDGRVKCFHDLGIAWTINSKLLVGQAVGGAGRAIDEMYQWVAAQYQ